MANINIKIDGNIQINVDDETFERNWLDRNWLSPLPLLDEIEKKILSIHHKKGGGVKGSESFASEWCRGGDVMGRVEVNYERI
jgi:hypothetical protein